MMFSMIGEKTRAGIQKRMDGTYPVEEAMTTILTENDFLYLLNPLPGSASSGGGKVPGALPEEPGTGLSRTARKKEAARKRKADADAAMKQGAGATKVPKGSGKGAKGGGKTSGKDPLVNSAGMCWATPDGEAICFGYQTGKCALCAPGESCPRGKHVCAKPACFKEHAMKDHR